MLNSQNPQLQTLVGKTIVSVKVSDSHGEVLRLEFTDGSGLDICTYDPITVRKGERQLDELYVGLNGQEL